MVTLYTLGIWTAKPGSEDAFVEAWNALASETAADVPGATAMLLRDRDQPNVFISLGPWESLEQIDAWRASKVFTTNVGRIRELVDGFEAHTMDVTTEIG